MHSATCFADDIRRIGREVTRDDHVARRGSLGLWRDSTVAVVGFQAIFWWLMFGERGAIALLVAALALGVLLAGALMQVFHGAVHQRRKMLVLIVGVGAPTALAVNWWRWKHVMSHHGHTNTGADDDLDVVGLFRLSPQRPWRPVHRFQPVLVPLMYPLLHLGMVGNGVRFAFTGRVCGLRNAQTRRWPAGTAQDLVMQLGPATAYVVIASVVHGVMATFFVVAAVSGVIGLVLSLVFVVEHTVASTRFVAEPGADWFAHQVRSSADAATHRRAFTWYVGGLNHHVEHHLFPKVPTAELPRLRARVSEACAAHGIQRVEYHTWGAAWRDHHRHLRVLARQPAPTVVSSISGPLSNHERAAASPAVTASENVP